MGQKDRFHLFRLLRIEEGDLSIETAGESSRLTFPSIDGPQAVADRIIDASHRIGVKGIVDDGDETKR